MTIMPLIFFFNDTATTEIYTLSLHDALPISPTRWSSSRLIVPNNGVPKLGSAAGRPVVGSVLLSLNGPRSEEHTSELQSRPHFVCRLLLEKKNHLQQLSPLH